MNNYLKREMGQEWGEQIQLPRFKHHGLSVRPRSLAFTSGNGTMLTIDS